MADATFGTHARPWGALLPVTVAFADGTATFASSSPRAQTLAVVVARALTSAAAAGRAAPRVPAFSAVCADGVVARLPLGVPVGALADAVFGADRGQQPLRVTALGEDGGLVGTSADAARETIASALGAAAALAKRYAPAATPTSTARSAAGRVAALLDAADAADAGDATLSPLPARDAPVLLRILLRGALFASRLAPATAPPEYARVVRVHASAHAPTSSLDAAIRAARVSARASYTDEDAGDGGACTAVLHGVDVAAVDGLGALRLAELVAAGAVNPDGWLYVAIV